MREVGQRQRLRIRWRFTMPKARARFGYDPPSFTRSEDHTWHENHPRVRDAEWFRGGVGTPPAEDHYVRIDDVLWNSNFYATAPSP